MKVRSILATLKDMDPDATLLFETAGVLWRPTGVMQGRSDDELPLCLIYIEGEFHLRPKGETVYEDIPEMNVESTISSVRSVQAKRKPPFFMNVYFDAEWVMHPGVGQYISLGEAQKFASGEHLRLRLPVAFHLYVDEDGKVSMAGVSRADDEKERLIMGIKAILKGIDEEEADNDDGWWETSTGAENGARKLAEIEALIRAL